MRTRLILTPRACGGRCGRSGQCVTTASGPARPAGQPQPTGVARWTPVLLASCYAHAPDHVATRHAAFGGGEKIACRISDPSQPGRSVRSAETVLLAVNDGFILGYFWFCIYITWSGSVGRIRFAGCAPDPFSILVFFFVCFCQTLYNNSTLSLSLSAWDSTHIHTQYVYT